MSKSVMVLKRLSDLCLEPETAEEAYRRGYLDGWIAAYYAAPYRRDQEMAYNRMLDHWAGPLEEWMRGDCTCKVPPPWMVRRSRKPMRRSEAHT